MKTPKRRIVWGFNPVTRTVKSKKRYRRAAEKQSARKIKDEHI